MLFTKYLYEGKIEKYHILISQEITKNCGTENINCDLCLSNFQCLKCKYNYIFSNNQKICLEENQEQSYSDEKESPNSYSTDQKEITISNKNEIKCETNEIIKGKCPYIKLNNEEFKVIYHVIKDDILTKNYTKENIIITKKDTIFQFSTLEQQKNYYLNLSFIDLTQCEKKIRDTYNISDEDSLIILKIDLKKDDLLSTYVYYEIFNPYTLEKLDLSICNDKDIIINIPIELDAETIFLYNSLNNSGYNLFNSSDPFYNDICTPYTSENKTDIILSDRRNIIYKTYGNLTLCQNGCDVEQYNSSNKRISCKCFIQKENEPEEEKVEKKFEIK